MLIVEDEEPGCKMLDENASEELKLVLKLVVIDGDVDIAELVIITVGLVNVKELERRLEVYVLVVIWELEKMLDVGRVSNTEVDPGGKAKLEVGRDSIGKFGEEVAIGNSKLGERLGTGLGKEVDVMIGKELAMSDSGIENTVGTNKLALGERIGTGRLLEAITSTVVEYSIGVSIIDRDGGVVGTTSGGLVGGKDSGIEIAVEMGRVMIAEEVGNKGLFVDVAGCVDSWELRSKVVDKTGGRGGATTLEAILEEALDDRDTEDDEDTTGHPTPGRLTTFVSSVTAAERPNMFPVE